MPADGCAKRVAVLAKPAPRAPRHHALRQRAVDGGRAESVSDTVVPLATPLKPR